MKDSEGNIIFEDTPWFKEAVPEASDRKRIKDVISTEQSGMDRDGNSKTKKGEDAGC